MKRNPNWIMFPGVLSALLIAAVAVSAVLGTVVLEAFAIRLEGGGSLTTMFPGFVYGTALIMKISLAEALVLGVVAVVMKVIAPEHGRRSVPAIGITSVILPATASLLGAIVIVIIQAFTPTPETFSSIYFSRISRMAVFALIAVIIVAKFSAIYSLVRRERPVEVTLIGLVTAVVYLVLFHYWEFYKLGFDQDRWNDI